jgi:hypothetical protein
MLCFRIGTILNIEYLIPSKLVANRWKGGFKMSYLICDKRKGSPKIHVEVCRRKCKLIQECKTYKEFVDNLEKKAA